MVDGEALLFAAVASNGCVAMLEFASFDCVATSEPRLYELGTIFHFLSLDCHATFDFLHL